jgi:hypothetical protein
MERAKIAFYKIDRCGYYKQGQTDPEFGNIRDIATELKLWACQEGMKLGQTCTYELDEHEGSDKTYCFDVVHDDDKDNFLLVTWNEVPSTKGTIASVKSLDSVGSAEVDMTELPEDSIPGYATYFWIIPSKDVFATIQFQHRHNGRRNLHKYLEHFLGKYTSNVVYEAHDNSKIEGYRSTFSGQADSHLSPRFSSVLYRKAGAIAFVRSNRERIRKVIRKETLSFQVPVQRAFWQELISRFGITEASASEEQTERFKLELEHTPTEEELEQMIYSWEYNGGENVWDDTGFKLQGDSNLYWLSHCYARNVFQINAVRKNSEIVDSQSLLDELIARRDEILRLLIT